MPALPPLQWYISVTGVCFVTGTERFSGTGVSFSSRLQPTSTSCGDSVIHRHKIDCDPLLGTNLAHAKMSYEFVLCMESPVRTVFPICFWLTNARSNELVHACPPPPSKYNSFKQKEKKLWAECAEVFRTVVCFTWRTKEAPHLLISRNFFFQNPNDPLPMSLAQTDGTFSLCRDRGKSTWPA